MKYSYTRHQVPRGSRPDAEVGDNLYLIKLVTNMRLTYQIRLLAYSAKLRGKQLVIRLPASAGIDGKLAEFVGDSANPVRIERV